MQQEHFEILLESIDSKLQVTMEAFSSLNEKIDRNHQELTEKIGFIDSKVMVLSQRVDSLEAKIDRVEENLNARIDGLHEELIVHRKNTELHRVPRKQSLTRAA